MKKSDEIREIAEDLKAYSISSSETVLREDMEKFKQQLVYSLLRLADIFES